MACETFKCVNPPATITGIEVLNPFTIFQSKEVPVPPILFSEYPSSRMASGLYFLIGIISFSFCIRNALIVLKTFSLFNKLGRSFPWSCMASRPQNLQIASIFSAVSLTKSPTVVTNGGNFCTIARAFYLAYIFVYFLQTQNQ